MLTLSSLSCPSQASQGGERGPYNVFAEIPKIYPERYPDRYPQKKPTQTPNPQTTAPLPGQESGQTTGQKLNQNRGPLPDQQSRQQQPGQVGSAPKVPEANVPEAMAPESSTYQRDGFAVRGDLGPTGEQPEYRHGYEPGQPGNAPGAWPGVISPGAPRDSFGTGGKSLYLDPRP